MEGTQATVRQGKHIPSGQGIDGNRKIQKRTRNKTASGKGMEMVAVPTSDRPVTNGHSGVDSSLKPLGSPWTEDEIQYLRDNWESMTSQTIARNIGRPMSSVKSKGYAMKLIRVRGNMPPTPRKIAKPSFTNLPRQRLQYRTADDASGRAADFLRSYDRVPMYRCNPDGVANHRGLMWRYGNAVLSDREVVAKAQRKGWDDNAWRALS